MTYLVFARCGEGLAYVCSPIAVYRKPLQPTNTGPITLRQRSCTLAYRRSDICASKNWAAPPSDAEPSVYRDSGADCGLDDQLGNFSGG